MLQSVGGLPLIRYHLELCNVPTLISQKNNLQIDMFILLSCTSHLKTRVLVFFKGIFGNRWCFFLKSCTSHHFFGETSSTYLPYPGFLSKINLTILLLPRPLLEPLPWLPLLPFAPVQFGGAFCNFQQRQQFPNKKTWAFDIYGEKKHKKKHWSGELDWGRRDLGKNYPP